MEENKFKYNYADDEDQRSENTVHGINATISFDLKHLKNTSFFLIPEAFNVYLKERVN